jgi:NAD(P)H-hydrate epimerase
MQAGIREFLEQGIISSSRMRAIDENARALGVTSLQMMESAGRSLAEIIRSRNQERILILCGKGNNGGDGLVAARYLQDMETTVISLGGQGLSPGCAHQHRALDHCSVSHHRVLCRDDVLPLEGCFSEAGVVVDALLGTGSSGMLREPVATLVEFANRSPGERVAADLPTPGFSAQTIVAFHRPKVEGSLVADIGVPLEAECFVGPGDLSVLRRKEPDAHKGDGGEVLIIGGGPYQGAPYLAGLGALRAGADIVRIASTVFEPIPDLIYERLEGRILDERHLDRILPLVRRADVVVAGNGLGDRSHDLILALAPCCKKAVFDADAIRKPLPLADDTLFTPHAGEFIRMTGNSPQKDLVSRGRAVRESARGCTILLKGEVDTISDGSRVRFNRTGSPLMTVGGTGDVLAGMAGALFCHLSAFDAACIAAYVNGRAGMAVERVIGGGMMASDLLDHIPREMYPAGRSERD